MPSSHSHEGSTVVKMKVGTTTNKRPKQKANMDRWMSRTPKGLKRPNFADISQARMRNVGSSNRCTQADKKTKVKGMPKAA